MPTKEKGAKKKAAAGDENPENLPSAPNNSLFGKSAPSYKEDPADPVKADKSAKAPVKRSREPQVSKEDPAVAILREAKKRKRAAGEEASAEEKGASSKAYVPGAQKAARPHADAVAQSNRLWEKLRSEKTPPTEREALISEVLTLFHGNVLSVLQKHDAARVLQSCFKQGKPEQRDALMLELSGEVKALARSHYGHFLLQSVLRHGTTAHKQQVLAELTPHAGELMVHAEGSAVLQQLYADVASGEQKNAMFRALWSKEVALMTESDAQFASLGQLFEADGLCKGRVLRRLEILLSKAARKGLAVTALVQRGAAEMLEHGDDAQRAELVSSFREPSVHIMHTRDGARIACGCLRHGDAKDRKALLKAMKGYVARAALDPHGALVLCTAMEAVDDTVLLTKALVQELSADLYSIALHAHGQLPLLQVLAPRAPRYFSPAQLSLMGAVASATSKKAPGQRRSELLPSLLPPLLRLVATHPAALAGSAHGGAIVFEALRIASGADDELSLDTTTAPAEAISSAFAALAAAATDVPPATAGEDEAEDKSAALGADLPIVVHHYGARLYKRLVQSHAAFASALLPVLAGQLERWSLEGAGWVVLALLECPATAAAVKAELASSASSLAKSAAQGCVALSKALPPPPKGKKGAAPAEPEKKAIKKKKAKA